MWATWKAFVSTLAGVDCHLNSVPPHLHVSFLKVFAEKIRHRNATTGKDPNRSRTVSDHLRTVSQEIRLGSKWRTDPRFDLNLQLEPELKAQLRGYLKQDPPPTKVKPIPSTLVTQACLQQPDTPRGWAVLNALVNGYFFLLRPGEYVYSSKNDHPFRLRDVTFGNFRGETSHQFNAATAPLRDIQAATVVLLNFTDQKNGDKDQPITHGDTADDLLSPVKAVRRQVLHLRKHRAPPDIPLYSYYEQGRPHRIAAKDLTNALRRACKTHGSALGLQPKDISVRALRNGGCVALLRAGVDPVTTKMMGRWHSWAMLECLQASSLETTSFAQRMVASGDYIIPRHQFLPADVLRMAQPCLPTLEEDSSS